MIGFGFLFPSGIANRIQQFFYWNLLLMVKVSVPSRPAIFAGAITVMPVRVLWREFMSALAVSLRTFNGSMRRHGQWLTRISFVGSLFLSRGPLAVFRTVGAVIVNAFNGHLERSSSHVGSEVFEPAASRADRSPAFAYINASTTPVRVVFAFFVFTPLNNVCPRCVERFCGVVSHGNLRDWFIHYTPYVGVDYAP